MVLIRYNDLDVYRLAFEVALEIHETTLSFPKIEQFSGVADQLRRSSKSICANLAEGFGKRMSVSDKKRYVQIAIGSATESRVWLSFSHRLGYVSDARTKDWDDRYEKICKMLYGLYENVKA